MDFKNEKSSIKYKRSKKRNTMNDYEVNFETAKKEWEAFSNETPEFRIFKKICDISECLKSIEDIVKEGFFPWE